VLEQVDDALAVTEAVEIDRRGSRVQPHRGEVHQVARDALHLGQQHPDVLAALGDLDAKELLDRPHVGELVGDGAQVVEAVGVGQHLGPGLALADLLQRAVQIADVDVRVLHELAVEAQDNAQHPVRTGVLGPHVDEQLFGLPRL